MSYIAIVVLVLVAPYLIAKFALRWFVRRVKSSPEYVAEMQ